MPLTLLVAALRGLRQKSAPRAGVAWRGEWVLVGVFELLGYLRGYVSEILLSVGVRTPALQPACLGQTLAAAQTSREPWGEPALCLTFLVCKWDENTCVQLVLRMKRVNVHKANEL